MRQLKFRAWDGTQMKTTTFMSMGRSDNLFVVTGNDGEELDGVPVMQFTGLKDKNGKEIFEGDIIKYKTNKIQFSLVQWISDGFKIVKKISPTSTRTSTLGNFIAEYQCEAIGNIYENQELLK